MVIKNDENKIVFTTKGFNLYDVMTSIDTKTIMVLNGKQMTVKEFKDLKNKGGKNDSRYNNKP